MRYFRTKSLFCDDFRGIATIISKVFQHCTLGRFQTFLSYDSQFGFKKGTGCRNSIYTVRNIVDKCIQVGVTVNVGDTVNKRFLYIQ